jgi:hypothetical protein
MRRGKAAKSTNGEKVNFEDFRSSFGAGNSGHVNQ